MDTITINGDSPQAVAFALLRIVAEAEGKKLESGVSSNSGMPDRAWLLDTYRECLVAVHGPAPTP